MCYLALGGDTRKPGFRVAYDRDARLTPPIAPFTGFSRCPDVQGTGIKA